MNILDKVDKKSSRKEVLVMSSPITLKISEDQAREMPMVDLAFLLLKTVNTPYYYRDLMQEIAKIKGLSEQQMMDVIAQLYTEINIDGRFACVGTNLWGLKRWYPVEKGEDSLAGTKRPRIINDEDDDLDEYVEEEETYDDDSGFDSYDTHNEFDSESESDNDSTFYEDEEIEEEIEEIDADVEVEEEEEEFEDSDDEDRDDSDEEDDI